MKAISVGEGYGRVNLIGEHLDYNGGCVLPLQIKNSIICELSENPEIECISIVSDKYQKTLSIEKLEKRDNWADFIIGSCLFFEKKYSIVIKELSFNIRSSLPLGIGLSSSAAITISTLKALGNYYKKDMSDNELINLAYDIENDFVGVGGGIMDQFVSVLGNQNQALFLNTLNSSSDNNSISSLLKISFSHRFLKFIFFEALRHNSFFWLNSLLDKILFVLLSIIRRS